MSELLEKEIDILVSQSVIPSKKYFSDTKPFIFMEEGVNILSPIQKDEF